MRYKYFLEQWKSGHTSHIFIFKNKAHVPLELLNCIDSFDNDSDLEPIFSWFGEGRLLFQKDETSSSQKRKFFKLFFNIFIKKPKKCLIVTTWDAILKRYPSISYILKHAAFFSVGEKLDKISLEQSYLNAGFYPESTLIEPKTFCKTGESFSICIENSRYNFLKIDWFGDAIEHLWIKALEKDLWQETDKIEIFPSFDFPVNVLSKQKLSNWFENSQKKPVGRQSKLLRLPEFLGPWRTILWSGCSSILDWMPLETRLIFFNDPVKEIERFWHFLYRESEQSLQDSRWPHPSLSTRFIPASEFFSHALMNNVEIATEKEIELKKNLLDEIFRHYELFETWLKKRSFVISDWPFFLQKTNFQDFTWIFCSYSSSGAEILEQLLMQNNQQWKNISLTNLSQKISNGLYHLKVSSMDLFPHSLISESEKCILLKETAWVNCWKDLEKSFALEGNKKNFLTPKKIDFIESLIELIPYKVNDYIAHEKYGVGRFLGLEDVNIGKAAVEFCVLEYADDAKIYIPVFAIGKIHPYALSSQANIELSSLNSKKWEKSRLKAEEHAKDVALFLLKEKAEKSRYEGIKIPRNYDLEKEFAEKCGFKETADQKTAIEAVLNDLASDKIMDRLVCGEVGFGKTEVAMRAAFNVISQKKQVMVLAPTTLLAQQHFDRFKKRFKFCDAKISCLSRFNSIKECAKIFQEVENGLVDILIGTHKLLNKQLKFKNLGLFVLDEEHRFGVLQKEMLAVLTHQVDRLTLTATPIPRTLSMAMHGLKDLSLIMTPPSERQPVKTLIGPTNSEECVLAIRRELEKGGQVYYVNNNIDLLPKIVENFQKKFPTASISYVHGKLSVKELEKRMLEYYQGSINILVCSVIIETGIDVSNANTLIVENADQFGLAQLHQLRGRVGRSTRQAYAYLYYSKNQLSRKAHKRLEALSQFSGLGAGFMLAEQDLEIRGAGDILGESQSGKSGQVGIGLYLELVSKAVHESKNTKNLSGVQVSECHLDLGEDLSFSKKYILSISERLKWYRRFALVKTIDEYEILQKNLVASYGNAYGASSLFLESVRLKLEAALIGITSIKHTSSQGKIEFQKEKFSLCKNLPVFFVKNLENIPTIFTECTKNSTLIWHYPKTLTHEQKLKVLALLIQQIKNILKK